MLLCSSRVSAEPAQISMWSCFPMHHGRVCMVFLVCARNHCLITNCTTWCCLLLNAGHTHRATQCVNSYGWTCYHACRHLYTPPSQIDIYWSVYLAQDTDGREGRFEGGGGGGGGGCVCVCVAATMVQSMKLISFLLFY